MNGLVIKSVQPQKWSPGYSPTPVGLHGGWSPAPLPVGPAETIHETLGLALAGNPDAVLAQTAVQRAASAGAIAVFTLPALATAYVGFRLGSLDKGFPSILGYVVGTLASLGVLAGLLGMVGAVTLPSGISGSSK